MKEIKQESCEPQGFSRRSFLKGGALFAGAALATSGVLTGCSETKDEPLSSTAGAVTASGVTYSVHNCDLLIIGSGFGAYAAANEAVSKGQRVVIVDKGPFRHGGNCGYNWDTVSPWMPSKDCMAQDMNINKSVNQELYYAMMEEEFDSGNPLSLVKMLNMGQTALSREEDGSLKLYSDYPMFKSIEGFFPRLCLDEMMKSSLITVYDKTMITDLVVNDGVCAGAVGMHLPTGEYAVFRAPATILATGPTNWIYGWTGVTAYTNGSADNTGDVDMAAFRRGAGIGNSEYACFDFMTSYPNGLGYGWGACINPDANEYRLFADKDGNTLFSAETGFDVDRAGAGDRNYFNTECAKIIQQGLGTEDGGLQCKAVYEHLRTIMKQNLPVFEKFGVDPLKELVPIHDEIYERGGSPVVDKDGMSADFKGLFCTRGAGGDTGTNGGSMAYQTHRVGAYVARRAMDYLVSLSEAPAVDWADVEKEIERLEQIRTREVDNGVRPHEIRHRIQNACGTCLGVLRETEKLEATVAELEAVAADIDKMVIPNQTKTYNIEWKEAIENYSLLDAALLAVKSTLMREETRGGYYRPDFPEVDDANWNCMLVGRKTDGEIVFEKVELPTVSAE